MRQIMFWIVAIVATAWNLFGIYDFTQTLAGNQQYLAGTPPELQAWIQAFPEWRKSLWGFAVFASVAGSFALLFRRAMAVKLFWVTVAAMVVGFGYDVALADGARYYGTFGLVFALVLVAIEALFALYAGWAARQGMLKRP